MLEPASPEIVRDGQQEIVVIVWLLRVIFLIVAVTVLLILSNTVTV
jgi:hypothetical protein